MMPIGLEHRFRKGRLGQHSTEMQSQRAHLLQPAPLSCAQLGRTFLQEDQTVSAGRDALRQLAANYLAFIQLASVRLWLRVNESTP